MSLVLGTHASPGEVRFLGALHFARLFGGVDACQAVSRAQMRTALIGVSIQARSRNMRPMTRSRSAMAGLASASVVVEVALGECGPSADSSSALPLDFHVAASHLLQRDIIVIGRSTDESG